MPPDDGDQVAKDLAAAAAVGLDVPADRRSEPRAPDVPAPEAAAPAPAPAEARPAERWRVDVDAQVQVDGVLTQFRAGQVLSAAHYGNDGIAHLKAGGLPLTPVK